MIRIPFNFAVAVLGVLLPVLAFSDSGGAPAADADNAYLDKLVGQWDMTGSMGSKSLHYHAVGERVLQGGFLRLHMVDAAASPQYEAEVFVGFDAHQHDYIAHWLDRFGAAGARVVGTGKRSETQLVMIFPYTDGAFRDTFKYMADSGTWSLLLESKSPNGTWSTFATYTMVRQH